MDQLAKAREIIAQVDRQMAELFVRRMEAAREVAAYKQTRGLPVLDAAQEQTLKERNSALIADDQLRDYYITFLEKILELSKSYQHRLMDGISVAYAGVPGAFADIAAHRIFPDGRCIGFDGFQAAYEAVEQGACDCAVLPVENSYAGEVGQVMDLMFHGSLYVNGVYTLPVIQNLLGVPGGTIQQVRTVLSHPQALSQCGSYLHGHGWEAVSESNTAAAAQKVARTGDPSLAAIASAETAELYGLNILERHVNVSSTNTTKFAVFSRVEHKPLAQDESKFILLFTVNDVAGALAKAISVIGSHGFNMKVLRSRPVRDRDWQYYFYVEAEGDEDSAEGRNMRAELAEQCDTLKIVGHYQIPVSLEEANP